jgi:hypothetical protein
MYDTSNMFQEAFEKLDLAEVATILDQTAHLFEAVYFDPVETVIMAINIPFYPGCRLLDIADYSPMPPTRRYMIYSPQNAAILNFTNQPIYQLNAEIPIKLDETTISDYTRFFFSFVRGRHGRFIICENIDDIQWKEDPPPSARKAIGNMIIPVTVKNIDTAGTYNLEATVVFKDSLFKTDIAITKTGTVTLSNEQLLIEDMPVLDDVFGQ